MLNVHTIATYYVILHPACFCQFTGIIVCKLHYD